MTVRIVIALLLSASTAFAADLPPGKKLEGELTVDSKVGNFYRVEHHATVAAGERIAVTATVKGVKRGVQIFLLDPSGKSIAASVAGAPLGGPGGGRPGLLPVGSTKLEVREVSASGTYTIVIQSDQIGAYGVTADYPAAKGTELKAEVETEATLAAEIARLEKQIAEKKAKLEAIRKK